VDRLLEEHGAVLVRQNKHLVYKLPNGNTFTRNKTPQDRRGPLNELSDLRHALGVVREQPKEKGERTMAIEHRTATGVAAPPIQSPAQPVAATPQPPAQVSLRLRIEAMISTEEASQERLLAEAQAHERRVQMLKALLPFAEDPATEDALRAVLPAVQQPTPLLTPPPAEPPQEITERVQVTRQLVFAATQTFDESFTINDVMSRMTTDRQINPAERTRIRQSIAQAVVSLFERGEVLKEAEHFGRKQTIWKKAALNGNGNGNGVGTRA
jgi:hypothetical protein